MHHRDFLASHRFLNLSNRIGRKLNILDKRPDMYIQQLEVHLDRLKLRLPPNVQDSTTILQNLDTALKFLRYSVDKLPDALVPKLLAPFR